MLSYKKDYIVYIFATLHAYVMFFDMVIISRYLPMELLR